MRTREVVRATACTTAAPAISAAMRAPVAAAVDASVAWGRRASTASLSSQGIVMPSAFVAARHNTPSSSRLVWPRSRVRRDDDGAFTAPAF